jgi:hypothetical protein
MSGRAQLPASGPGSTRRGLVDGFWATPCSATACAGVAKHGHQQAWPEARAILTHPHRGSQDVTAVGILPASAGLDATITAYATGAVDPRPLVAATVGLEQVGAVLPGNRPEAAGPGPKIHVDPQLG